MKSTLFVVGIVQVCFILKFSINNAAQVKFTNAVCKSHNESWVILDTCRLRAINRNKTVFNLNATFLHPVHSMYAEFKFFSKGNSYQPWLYKPLIDICRFLKKPYHPVVVMVYNLLKNYSNFNTRCPLLGPYYLDGFHVLYENIGVPWPSGDFLLKINWLVENRSLFSTNVYFLIQE